MTWVQAIPILKKLEESGHSAYVVGGAVRDFLLQRPITDVDVASSAAADEVRRIFPKTVQMNNNHETVLLFHNGIQAEVTTLRGRELKEDLQHRDLTINALAMDVHGELIDPTGGQVDLEQGLLRAYDPARSFADDPLRLLRVARFHSELGFAVDPLLKREMTQFAETIATVAKERVVKELWQLLAGSGVQGALSLLCETGVGLYLPGLRLGDVELKKLQTIPSVHWESECRSWAELLVSLRSADALSELPLANKTKQVGQQIWRMYQHRMRAALDDGSLYENGLEVAVLTEEIRKDRGLQALRAADVKAQFDSLPITRRSELAISGKDLLNACQDQPGPWLAEALAFAEYAVVTRQLENKRELLLKAALKEVGRH
ncbi:CCA tRNA nucleotidyltransferase [Shouchella shacheensis]|uniref:CCA tRNA nucleotidyltransferase n=1 Tax=Shouchella shacheensis TaxID=1649580 RepID=UPI00073FABD4|nr:CCA tRNA nucleotidyltransferase [Shouchella shacheensis]